MTSVRLVYSACDALRKKAARSPRCAWYKVSLQNVLNCIRYGYKPVKTATCAKKAVPHSFENYVPMINCLPVGELDPSVNLS